jgi:NADH-quinone oxidoreductase subunit J
VEWAAFIVLAVLALAAGLVVVMHRHAVVCALALAANLVAIAGLFLVLRAQFIAFVQVIVYAGAIMVLILFVLMVLSVRDEQRMQAPGPFQKVLAPLAALGLAGLLVGSGWAAQSASAFPAPSAEFGTVGVLGRELFTRFYYPFEAISLLLVVAMVGAVLLAKKRL